MAEAAQPYESAPNEPEQFQMPEKFAGKSAEDIARSYVELERMHGQRIQEADPILQRVRELEPYGGLEGVLNSYRDLYNQNQQITQAYQQMIQGNQPQNQQPQQPQPVEDNWMQNWDYLSPQDQARLLEQRVSNAAMQQLQQYGQRLYEEALQRLNAQVETGQGSLQRQFDVFRQLLDVQRQYPDMNGTELLQDALNLTRADPTQLLQTVVESRVARDPKRIESELQKRMDAWKAAEEEKRRNEEMTTWQNQGGTPLATRFQQQEQQPPNPADVRKQVMERLLNDPDSGFTSAAQFTG